MAPFPELSNPAQAYLGAFLNQYLTPAGSGPGAVQPTDPFNWRDIGTGKLGQKMQARQTGQPVGGQTLAGTPTQNPFNQAIQEQFLTLMGQNTGQDVIAAAEPVFQRQLQFIREQAPSRFNTAFMGEQGRALQDFNLFQQQVLESGLNRQLAATQGAGQFGLGLSGMDLQQLMAALGAGGAFSAPGVVNDPGWFGQILNAGATVAGAAPWNWFGGGGSPAQKIPFNPWQVPGV